MYRSRKLSAISKNGSNDSADSMFHPPKSTILFTGLWRFIPPSILRYVEYLPMHELKRLKHFLTVSRNTAKSVLELKAGSESDEDKDMLTILGTSDCMISGFG
jgi:hypothetical protein